MLNKYGFQTENSGILHLRFQTVISQHVDVKAAPTEVDLWVEASRAMLDKARALTTGKLADTRSDAQKQPEKPAKRHWRTASQIMKSIVYDGAS